MKWTITQSTSHKIHLDGTKIRPENTGRCSQKGEKWVETPIANAVQRNEMEATQRARSGDRKGPDAPKFRWIAVQRFPRRRLGRRRRRRRRESRISGAISFAWRRRGVVVASSE